MHISSYVYIKEITKLKLQKSKFYLHKLTATHTPNSVLIYVIVAKSYPNRGKNIAELSVGIVLTDLLITSPIGIPMVCHATTKMKNQGWYEKKIKFEKGLQDAENISNPAEKQAYYNNLLRECRMTDKKHQKQMKKIEKQNRKNAKKSK